MIYHFYRCYWSRGTIDPSVKGSLSLQNNNKSFAASTKICCGAQKIAKLVIRLLGFVYYFMSRWRHWNNLDLFRNARRNDMPDQRRNAEKDRRPKEPHRERKADPRKPREDRPQRRDAQQRGDAPPARRDA